MEDVELKAPNIFLYANESIAIMKGSLLMSLKEYSCDTQTSQEQVSKMYKCMSNEFDAGTFDYQYFLDYYRTQYGTTVKDISQMKDKIMTWWNIYIMTHGKLTIQGTQLLAPKVGLCAGDITLMSSKIDTSWKGCPHDQGRGNQPRNDFCAGPGASHAGDGGFGGVESDDPQERQKCMAVFPTPYYFGKEAAYEGSGGTSGDWKKVTGGAGGGIIWSHTPGTTQMNSSSYKADG